MNTLWLRARAPFAAFRYFQAGVYRSTCPTIPHTAAWGLILNLAGIETRIKQEAPVTEIDPAAPRLRIAVGSVTSVDPSRKSTMYQQLHSYPVGSSGKETAGRTKGAKYWIAPVRREILVDFDAIIGVQSEDRKLVDWVTSGLNGQLSKERYGLPFAGDNNLLFDSIDILDKPESAFWFVPISQGDKPRPNSCRLTGKIDRTDSSKTVSGLFAPTLTKMIEPPDDSWIWTPSD